LSTPRGMKVRHLQGSVLAPPLYSLYINDTPQTLGSHLTLFADGTFLYATDSKEPSTRLTATERWNIKINEAKTQVICLSHRLKAAEVILTLDGIFRS
jgi:hypothetical protein